jgi:hypothetical protein
METKEQRGERAFYLSQELKNNEKIIRDSISKQASILEEIRDAELYKESLGQEDGSWAGYLSDPEIHYTRAWADKLIKIKHKLVDDFKFNFTELLALPFTRLSDIVKVANNKEQAEKLIDIARVATPMDWKEEINGLLGKHTQEDGHEHSFQKYEICSICGLRHKIGECEN